MADYQGQYTGPQIDERLALAGTAYQKPENGIPGTDMSIEVRKSLLKADASARVIGTYAVGSGNFLKFVPGEAFNCLVVIAKDRQPQKILQLSSYADGDNLFAGYDITGASSYLTTDSDGKAYIYSDGSNCALKNSNTNSNFTVILLSGDAPTISIETNFTYELNVEIKRLLTSDDAVSSDVFIAQYGESTEQEVWDAILSGKLVALKYQDYLLYYSYIDSESAPHFVGVYSDWNRTSIYETALLPGGTWDDVRYERLQRNKLVSSFQNVPDNDHYPSEKLVYDSFYKRGVISQTQTWTQAQDGGYDYVMSNLVYGNIPKSNIDLYEAAGATFNATTGYFELNGLTDISYEEMQRIYNLGVIRADGNSFSYVLEGIKTVRTILLYHSQGTWPGYSLSYAFLSTGIESIPLDNIYAASVSSAFYRCMYCKDFGRIRVQAINNFSDFLSQAISLVNVELSGLKASLSLSDSPHLSVASILYMINNEAATSAITITLHATAYARATADADITAALANHPNVTLASA